MNKKEGKMNRKTIKAIEKARERMRKGNFITQEEARKRLGLKMNKNQIRKTRKLTWEEITKPFKEAAKKSGLKESDVTDLIHRLRKVK